NPQVGRARIVIAESQWDRFGAYCFARGAGERRTTEVSATRQEVKIQSGIDDMVVLKTTGSGFVGYKKDRYTTLKETGDRILATAIRVRWDYGDTKVAFGAAWT